MVRLYSLYSRARHETRWKRISDSSYPKPVAIRVFQSRLIHAALGGYLDERGNPLEYRLRPITIVAPEAR